MGGGIYYDLYRPKLNNNIFENNSAIYGPDIASYPIKIKMINISSDDIMFDELVSGQTISPSIELCLVDHDEQIVLNDYSSKITISKINSNTTVSGTNEVVVKGGVATFSDLTLIAKPTSENVPFNVHSPSLNSDILNLQYNSSLSQANILASFRICESGEKEENDQCIE